MNKKEVYWSSELKKICQLLSSNNAIWFLDHGTLLGAIRDDEFIPWDNDIDLGIVNLNLDSDFAKIKVLVKEFKYFGYSSRFFGDSIYLLKEGIEFGIKFYQKKGDNYEGIFIKYERFNMFSTLFFLGNYTFYEQINRNSNVKNFLYASRVLKIVLKPFRTILFKLSNIEVVNLIVPATYLSEFKKIIFYEDAFSVPVKSIEYLRFKYGDKWNIPVKNYNYMKDDGAIKGNQFKL